MILEDSFEINFCQADFPGAFTKAGSIGFCYRVKNYT